uniref:Spore coat protein n=1 Tax=Heterorhabditis bacteriophora TaxID=37862 RepID=A0A1I7WWW3_HETBA
MKQDEEEIALSAKHGAYMMPNYYDKGAMVPYGYNTYGGYGGYPYYGQYNSGYYGYMTYGR